MALMSAHRQTCRLDSKQAAVTAHRSSAAGGRILWRVWRLHIHRRQLLIWKYALPLQRRWRLPRREGCKSLLKEKNMHTFTLTFHAFTLSRMRLAGRISHSFKELIHKFPSSNRTEQCHNATMPRAHGVTHTTKARINSSSRFVGESKRRLLWNCSPADYLN